MGLRLHGPRKLSNLEKAALHLVFNAYPKSFPKKKFKHVTYTDITAMKYLRMSHKGNL